MTYLQILIAVIIIVGLILLSFLLYYIFGNVYSGFVKRKQLVDNSYNELKKIIFENFEYIPSILQNIELDDIEKENLQTIYREYLNIDKNKIPPYQLVSITYLYYSEFKKIVDKNPSNPIVDFIVEHIRLTTFSIPLYNSKVSEYNKFINLPINRFLKKIFDFKECSKFEKTDYFTNTSAYFTLKTK